ncbi:hypothetical protein R3W88_023260 [Solanum pinnatisectum]|uniref:RNase H type-1 domain-containing protein n=1 Tax=Solanum pinnatisectum TaxID=50273 RepID=A0AAV9M0T7_9SOLN|nr:hypothetical protein R3W88_023260 [Solanum pinnatisectum]
MAFSVPIECSSHNETEAKASLYGCKWCIQNGYTNLNIELDSSLIVGMLTYGKARGFKLNTVIEDTSALLRQAPVNNTYVSYQQLPKGEKGLFLMDKRQIPNIRSKFDKANFYAS